MTTEYTNTTRSYSGAVSDDPLRKVMMGDTIPRIVKFEVETDNGSKFISTQRFTTAAAVDAFFVFARAAIAQGYSFTTMEIEAEKEDTNGNT